MIRKETIQLSVNSHKKCLVETNYVKYGVRGMPRAGVVVAARPYRKAKCSNKMTKIVPAKVNSFVLPETNASSVLRSFTSCSNEERKL